MVVGQQVGMVQAYRKTQHAGGASTPVVESDTAAHMQPSSPYCVRPPALGMCTGDVCLVCMGCARVAMHVVGL